MRLELVGLTLLVTSCQLVAGERVADTAELLFDHTNPPAQVHAEVALLATDGTELATITAPNPEPTAIVPLAPLVAPWADGDYVLRVVLVGANGKRSPSATLDITIDRSTPAAAVRLRLDKK